MDDNRLAAALIASGLGLLVIAGLVTPRGMYAVAADDERLRAIAGARARFVVAQLLWALWLVVPGIGFVLLSRELSPKVEWLPTVADLAVLAAAATAALFVALQSVDPRRFWLEGKGRWASTASTWSLIAAAALFGLAMAQTGSWEVAGIALLAYAAVGVVAALRATNPAFYIGVGFCVAGLVPAFVLWQLTPA